MGDFCEIKGLLFDKDGTLVDFTLSWLQPIREAANLVATHANQPELANELLIHGGYLPESNSWANDSIIAFETSHAMLDSWVKLTSPALMEPLIPKIQRIVTAALFNAVPIIGNTKQLFNSLTENYVLGVASMDDEINVKQTLSGLELHESLDFYCGADSGFGHKPGAGMVHAFCQQTSLLPENIAVIGDGIHDMKMAKAAGAMAIAVESGASSKQDLAEFADYMFVDIAEFSAQLI